MRAVAINIGANTNEPGFRGPVFPDGTFEYLPIPESEPTTERVPTYGDLAPELATPIPDSLRETPVHLDPEFPEYPCCEQYTYGDEHGVKAGPLSELSAGDMLLFYATLTVDGEAAWLPPDWGAFIIGHFVLAAEPVTPQDRAVPESERAYFENNAHTKRDPPDARVLVRGEPEQSQLYETAVALSSPAGGTEANDIVTELSADSGRGPWWRRPLRFDDHATARLRERLS
ncbi:hypothetical protein [Halovenus halobia]|uniref:Nmad3 family putative nucleotide modification protein n=1 Tax=Halovenus halobia TaxID=3396622 RepID=UPI003F54619F